MKIKNNAEITIISCADSFDGNHMELVCDGAYYEKDSSKYIMYDEKEENGMQGCSVMIKITEDEVTVSRKGAFSSKMLYRQGETTEFTYRMPYGEMKVILHTKKIKKELSQSGGSLGLFYTLTMQGEDCDYSMRIKVKKNS